MSNEVFDFKKVLEDLKSGKPLSGKDGILTPLVKKLTEAALEAELDYHLNNNNNEESNRRNGKSSKLMKSTSGTFELNVPRERNGTFEPQFVKKYQNTLSDEIESKIIAMYGLGMSYTDISKEVEDIYGISISTGAISAITDKIIEVVREWQNRPLESIYPFIWLDAIHYKIKEDGKYMLKAVYTIIGIDLDGKKDVLGLYISETEGANFWLSVLTDLQNRGVEDILITSVDGLKGFPEAINSIYPKTEVQLCIIHQIRNSLKYVASKDKKAFMRDLKLIYRAANKDVAERALDDLEDKWNKKYSIVTTSWRNNWDNLTNYFKYPSEIRKIMYTTNVIESVHRQFRKLTKTKGAFPNEDSLLKLLYLGIQNAKRKWTQPIPNWGLILSQLSIFFEGRLEKALKL
jgi:transposase-like protein